MKNILSAILICACVFASAQNSIIWSAGMNVAGSSYGNLHPRIVTDGIGNPVIIWGRMTDESVFISRWNGSSFTTPVNVNPAWLTVATASWMGPDIAAKGDTVYVAMKQTPEDSNHPVYLATSFDGGTAFSDPAQVDFIADSISRFPTVTVNNQGNPIVGFMKFDPDFSNARWVVTTSNDAGNTFSEDVKASGWSGGNGTVCDCCPGSILSSGDMVAMLYRDNLSNIRDMWAGISTDGGNSFTQGIAIDQGNWFLNLCPSSGPDGIIVGDTLYSTFMSGASGMDLVYRSKASLSDMQGGAGTALTGNFPGLSSQNYPRIAHDGTAAAIVWKQYLNNASNIALLFSNNVVTGFSSQYDTVAASTSNDLTNADVAVSPNTVHVVWQDDYTGTVKYRKGTFSSVTSAPSFIENTSLIVFPNPSNDLLEVHLSGINKQVDYTITNLAGQTLINSSSAVLNGTMKIDLSTLARGTYFLKVIFGSQTSVLKFLKQ